jgi:hypothetical protein
MPIIGGMSGYVIRGPLTYELALKDSPVRQFFDDRLTPSLRDVQAVYRRATGPLQSLVCLATLLTWGRLGRRPTG